MRLEVEIFRVLSMFGVIYFHSELLFFQNVAYGGLVFFTVTAVFFLLNSLNRNFSMINKIRSLIIPWSFWFLFYGFFSYIVNGYFFHQEYSFFSMVFASPSLHLWFVPFIFISFYILSKFRRIFNEPVVGIFSCWLAIVLILTSSSWLTIKYLTPLGQYLHIFPALLIGIFIFNYKEVNLIIARFSLISLYVVVSFMAMFFLEGYSVTYLIGLLPCLFLLISKYNLSKDSLLFKISSCTFGVYLSHIFVFSIFRYIGVDGIYLSFFVFFFSYIAVAIFRYFSPRCISKIVFG